MILSVGQYIRFRDSSAAKDRLGASFVAHVHQKFLITEIRGFLKHKLFCAEEMVVDRQTYAAYLRVFFLDVKSVLAVPRVRENSQISELQN